MCIVVTRFLYHTAQLTQIIRQSYHDKRHYRVFMIMIILKLNTSVAGCRTLVLVYLPIYPVVQMITKFLFSVYSNLLVIHHISAKTVTDNAERASFNGLAIVYYLCLFRASF